MTLFKARARALFYSIYSFLMTILGWTYGHRTTSVLHAQWMAAVTHANALELELANLDPSSETVTTKSTKLQIVREQERELRTSLPAA